MEEKKKNDEEKEKHREKVMRQKERTEELRKRKIIKKIKRDEEMVKLKKEILEEESKAKARAAYLKRKDREEEAKRIAKVNEYKKEQILEKIEMDNERAYRIKQKKADLINTRYDMRKHIGTQKAKINEAFSKARSGNINELKRLESEMVRSTVVRPQQRSLSAKRKHINNSFKGVSKRPHSVKKKNKRNMNALALDEAIEAVKQLRDDLYNELIKLIEQEQANEDERDELLKNVSFHLKHTKATEEEAKRLTKMFVVERAKALEQITNLSK